MTIKDMQLMGKQILITRPEVQGKTLAARLEQAGAQVVSMPVIEITEPDSWQALDQAIENLGSYQWLIFASSNAVVSFAGRMKVKYPGTSRLLEPAIGRRALETLELAADHRNRRGGSHPPVNVTGAHAVPLQSPGLSDRGKFPKVAVIGKITADTAFEHGLAVDYCPDTYLAEEFIAHFPDYPNLAQTRILWPRTNIGRNYIADKLEAAGAIVDVIPAYKTVLPENAKELSKNINQLLLNKKLDAITLTSKQTAINLSRIISLNLDYQEGNLLADLSVPTQQSEQLKDVLADVLIVTIGPQTSEGALNYLGKQSIEASPSTADGMIAALIEHYRGKSDDQSECDRADSKQS